MFGMFETLTAAARKRSEYRRTVAELSRLDRATAKDLGIHEGNIVSVAREAVYGR